MCLHRKKNLNKFNFSFSVMGMMIEMQIQKRTLLSILIECIITKTYAKSSEPEM